MVHLQVKSSSSRPGSPAPGSTPRGWTCRGARTACMERRNSKKREFFWRFFLAKNWLQWAEISHSNFVSIKIFVGDGLDNNKILQFMTRTTAATSRSINEPGKKPRRRLALTIYTCATLSMIQREGGYVSFVICSHLVHSTAPLRPSGPLPAASRCFVYLYRWFKSKIWRSFLGTVETERCFF